MHKPVVLIILDGWGYCEDKINNPIAEAKTPFFDSLWQKYNPTLLEASGEYVGLPSGQMGNSEVGHMTIGAGTIVYTDLTRINKSIGTEAFDQNPAFQKLFDHVKKYNSFLHIEGLIGPGGIHSHSDHLFAFLKLAKANGIEKIIIDAFTDGRDTAPQSAYKYLKELEDVIDDLGIGFIATASGRFYAMDRDKNWDRLEKVEKMLFNGEAKKIKGKKPSQLLNELYGNGTLDEHLEPVIFLDDKDDSYPIAMNDGVFFFNYRADRARMLTEKIVSKQKELNLFFVTMTEYDKSLDAIVAFPPINIETTLAAEIAKAGFKQSHIAETEKFAHATYFLNGGREEAHQLEKHILVQSRKDITTHDQAPEMKAKEIADATIKAIADGDDFIFVNFANPDMVGHTANYPAIITAIETVDTQLSRIIQKISEKGGVAFITADHGNAELFINPVTGEKHTAHTTNLVPAILTLPDIKLNKGGLADIAPTILSLMNLTQPKSMTGINLIIK